MSFLPLACSLPSSDFYTLLAIKTTILPLGPVALVWTYALCAKPGKRRKARQTAAKLSLLWVEIVLTAGEYTVSSSILQHHCHSLVVCLCTSRPLVMAVSTTITQTFACDKVDGDYFLRAQMTLACDSSSTRRQTWVTFAVFMLLAYPIGFPLLLLCLLLPQRARIRKCSYTSCCVELIRQL